VLEGVKLSNVNWICLYMLTKVLVWFNSVLLIYFSYRPWKVLEFDFDKWTRTIRKYLFTRNKILVEWEFTI